MNIRDIFARSSRSCLEGRWDFNPVRYHFGVAMAQACNLLLLGGSAGFVAWQSGGLQLAFCAAAGALALDWHQARQSDKELCNFLKYQRYRDLHEVGALVRFFAGRAGLKRYVDVKIIDTCPADDGCSVAEVSLAHAYKSMVVVYPFSPLFSSESMILIGGTVVDSSSPEQLAAMICHEIGHLKVQANPAAEAFIFRGLQFHSALVPVALVLSEPALAALAAGTYFAGRVIAGVGGQFDELRADYNSMGLFPVDRALADGLFMLASQEDRSAYLKPSFSFFTVWKEVCAFFFDPHPGDKRREKALERAWPQVQKFYEKNPDLKL